MWLVAGVMIPEASTALGKVMAMQAPHIVQMGRPDGIGVALPLAKATLCADPSRPCHGARDLRALNIKPSLVQNTSLRGRRPIQPVQHRSNLLNGHHHRQPGAHPHPDEILQIPLQQISV